MILIVLVITAIIIAIIIVLVVYQRVQKCEECKVCPELVKGEVELDIQFSENNKPSKVLDNIFNGRNVYLGGYSLDF